MQGHSGGTVSLPLSAALAHSASVLWECLGLGVVWQFYFRKRTLLLPTKQRLCGSLEPLNPGNFASNAPSASGTMAFPAVCHVLVVQRKGVAWLCLPWPSAFPVESLLSQLVFVALSGILLCGNHNG